MFQAWSVPINKSPRDPIARDYGDHQNQEAFENYDRGSPRSHGEITLLNMVPQHHTTWAMPHCGTPSPQRLSLSQFVCGALYNQLSGMEFAPDGDLLAGGRAFFDIQPVRTPIL
jgi:hypothetical protein